MAVTLDAVSPVLRLNAANDSTNVQVSMDVAADANYALIFVDSGLLASQSDASIVFPVITLGGSSNFTQVVSALKHAGSDAGTAGFVDIYKLASPPTGAARTVSITMTYTGIGASAQLIAWCETYKGVDISGTPLGTAQTASGAVPSSLTLTDTLTANDYFVGICGNGAAAPGVTTGVSDASATGSTNTGCDNARLAHNTGSGSTSIVFSTNTWDMSCATGVKLLPATAGGSPNVGNAPVTVTANSPTISRSDVYVVASNGAALSTNDPAVTFAGTYTPLENDVIALFVSSATVLGAVANASLPAGWVNPLGDGVEVNSDQHGMACFYHLVTAGEQSGVTLTYTATNALDATETGYVQAVAVRNVDPANVIDGFNTAFDSGNTVTPHVLAGITGSGVLLGGSLVVSSVAKDGTGDYGSTAPSGWTWLRNDNTSNGRWLGYRDGVTTVDTNVTATNITPSAGDEYCSITLAFARAPAAGTNVTIPAAAGVTVTANNASHAVAVNVGVAAVTSTANGVNIARRVDVGSAAVAATANNSSASVKPTTGTATVASTANNSSSSVKPTTASAPVTATGNNATVSTTSNVNVTVGFAAVTATGNNPSHSIANNLNEIDGVAYVFGDSISNTGDTSAQVAGNVGTAAVTVTGNNATVSTTSNVNVDVGSAAVTVAANNVTAAPSPSVGNATVTALANNPSHAIAPTTGYALVTVAGNNVTIPGVAFYVTSVSGNGHYLLDQNSDPYFVSGNSPQNMVANAPLSEMETFFADQQARGFNSAQVHLVYNFAADAETATDPFGVDGNLAPQNSGYWATIDSMFDLAETYGFTLWATVIDNISCGSTVESSVSTGEAFSYGQFLGARYKDRPGLVWVVGNDFDSSQWSARNAKYLQIIAGIQDQGDTHLVTVWNNQQAGNANTAWDTVQTIDNGYEYDTPPYEQIGVSYALTRTGFPKPVVWFEGTYYNEHNANPAGTSTDLELRRLAWWTITWGGVGHFFGTEEVWNFDDWTSELTANIYDHLQLIPGFMTELTDWELMVPDTGNLLLTGGKGTQTGSLDTSTYATAAYVPAGVTAAIYFPTSRGSITVDTTKLSGTVTGYWWDPTDGSTSVESTPAAPTHPGNNTGGDGDWVLVLQGSAAVNVTVGYAAITVTGNSASHAIAPTTGNAAVTATGNNASHTIASTIGTAAVTSTANNSSATVASTIGAAAVTATGNNAGHAIASTIGTSVVTVTGNNATPATTSNVNVSVGSAAVGVAANDPSHSIKPTAGTAVVASTGNNPTVVKDTNKSVAVGTATVAATANNPSSSMKPTATTATVTATGNNPTLELTAVAGFAAVTATGNPPSLEVATGTILAAVTVVAYNIVFAPTVHAISPERHQYRRPAPTVYRRPAITRYRRPGDEP